MILPLLIIPVASFILFSQFSGSYLLGVIAFYLLPGVYIAIKNKKFPLRPFLFSCIASAPFVLVVDYIGTVGNLWIVPESLFPRLLSVIPFEDYAWMVSAVITTILVCRILHEQDTQEFSRKKIITLVSLGIVASIVFLILYFVHGSSLFVFNTRYLYLILASVAFGLPTLLLGIYYRKDLVKYIPAVCYFFLLTVLFEISAITNSWWKFSGTYFLPALNMSGNVLPLEELFFVGIVGPLMAVLLYKFIFKQNTGSHI